MGNLMIETLKVVEVQNLLKQEAQNGIMVACPLTVRPLYLQSKLASALLDPKAVTGLEKAEKKSRSGVIQKNSLHHCPWYVIL